MRLAAAMVRGLAIAVVVGFAGPAVAGSTLTLVRVPFVTIFEPTIALFPRFNGLPIAGPNIWTAADLRGDGRKDLIVGSVIDPTQPTVFAAPMRILRPRADGSGLADVTRALLGNGPLPSTEHVREIVVADFNGDGRQDVFVAAHGYDAFPYAGERNVLLVSNGDGSFTDGTPGLPLPRDFSHSVATGDVNGDGLLDLFVGNVTHNVPPYFLMGRPGGRFEQVFAGLPEEVLNVQQINRFHASLLIDIDGDGHLDLVVGSGYAGETPSLQTVVYYNDGAGDFTKRPRTQFPFGPFGATATVDDIVALDVNDDGRMDLLILTTQSAPRQDLGIAIQVLVNQGSGVFTDESIARLGSSASRTNGRVWVFLRVADLDGDGRLDFYAQGYGGVGMNVPIAWLNNGNGTFTAQDSRSVFFDIDAVSVEAIDVDGDGRPDFVSVGVDADGNIGYDLWLNRTPRTVPSEPVAVSAIAGDGRITLAFRPPLGDGPSPITGYTATCALGTSGSGLKAAGVASPITVSGLTNGRTYACSVTATSATGTSLPSRALSGRPLATILDLNQHGLTGSWYEPATSGQGVEVEVFPNPSSGTGSAFVSWFTYDTVVGGGAERQRWYTAQGPVVTGQPSALLTIYQNTGGNFNAPPVTNAQAVGTATLSFDTCSSGQLLYNFTDGTGRTGTIPLTRLLQNMTCSTTTPYPTNADFALSGNWYNPATSGQGFTIEVNPNSGAFFAAWYTYAPNGAGTGAAGQRWYTAQAGFAPGLRSVPVTMYQTSGGVFDMPTPPGQNTVVVGTGTMAFQSCSAATFSYNFTGGSSNGASGTIALQRAGPVPAGCAL